ncbi:MAG TPA: dTDP-4-dehydrorhamnose 3,5-epimerase [Chitinophaga sp.]|uniref:dTDP-4-dehydrorhamnose 3,5-epimerase n=1 Tax=Chitinophaga tropicalis TaxID=2683588 RepID=A0A7K1U9M8_9BACT|nr:dTDP-4-dehydrorhamnose 3,5-epimerase [Chitinophaga tropicalis]MVT11077.1 dTDP-4-dehydrorhamnose 3,5-epimerase [Chitinophaga tropicalis]HJT72378.1 dTDP-4-dehydrorhamnose 3,5-epimerase [Chitinophaga sp.]
MPFTETGIPGLLVYEPKVFNDNRGYFFESYSAQTFEKEGVQLSFVQDNQARSTYGVLRGLHYQQEPYAQTKLVRVLEGRIIDVAVDIRKGSPTYGKSFAIELSAENKLQLLVPKGFAHGYAVISETAEVMYKVDNFYNKASEGGIIYNDPALNIDWGIQLENALVSEKDLVLPALENCVHNFVYNTNN